MSEWGEVSLKEVASYSKERINVEELKFSNYVTTESMKPDKQGITDAASLPSTKTASKYSKGDILVSNIRPYFKKIWRADREGGSSSDVLVIQNQKRNIIDSQYLYYCLFNDKFFDHIMAGVKGAKMPRGDKDEILKYTFYLPPMFKQKRIATLLANIDSKIKLNKRMNKTLEEIAMTFYKHWFIDFGPFQDGEFVESELGLIPKGWKVVKLNEVVDVNSKSVNKNFPYEKISYIDISSVHEGTLESYTDYKLSDAPSRAKRLVSSGDVIWSTVRPNRKSYLYIYKPYPNTVVSTGFVVLKPIRIPSTYLYLHVTTNRFISYLVKNVKGSAYPAVNSTIFKGTKLLLPPKEVLKQFDNLVFPYIKLAKENAIENNHIGLTRDYLLPKLLSGEIDLSKAEDTVEQAIQ